MSIIKMSSVYLTLYDLGERIHLALAGPI